MGLTAIFVIAKLFFKSENLEGACWGQQNPGRKLLSGLREGNQVV